jgi:hypothetical protein
MGFVARISQEVYNFYIMTEKNVLFVMQKVFIKMEKEVVYKDIDVVFANIDSKVKEESRYR